MSALDIVDAYDFNDDELVSVLGKKNYKSIDGMYANILDIVRNNPLN
jgi:predicted protein tyrosine phosphatase